MHGLNAVISIGCTIAEMWTDGSLESEDLETQIENSIRLLKSAASVLPGGAGLAFQLTLNALTAKTALEVVAPFTGPFGAVYFAVFDVYHAWKNSKDNPQLFWVKAICAAADLAMMVWMAKAKCFVAGTPVVVGIRYVTLPAPDQSEDADSYLLDVVGGISLAVGVGIVATSRRRRRQLLAGQHQLLNGDSQRSTSSSEDSWDTEPANATNDGGFEDLIALDVAALRVSRSDRVVNDSVPWAQAVREEVSPPQQSATVSIEEKSVNRKSWLERLSLPFTAFVAFFVAWVCLVGRPGSLWDRSQAQAVAAMPVPAHKLVYETLPIEKLKPGDRVLATNPEGKQSISEFPEPDSTTWRLVTLQTVGKDNDSGEIKLIRPANWLVQHRIEVGREISFNLVDLGLQGSAGVLSIAPCPPIQSGDGKVVTGTFRHVVHSTVDVQIPGRQAIRSTPGHLFWSEDREDYIQAKDLNRGERLRTPTGGTVTVQSVTWRNGSQTVYNLEVHGEHVYFVSNAGVLVHNSNIDFDPNQELFWLFGPNPNVRATDDDGMSVWRTTNRQEVETFMNARNADGQANTNHGVYTRQELEGMGFVLPHTQDKANHQVLKDKLQHHSVRPANNPDPNVKLSSNEIGDMNTRLKASPPKAKHKPKIFNPC